MLLTQTIKTSCLLLITTILAVPAYSQTKKPHSANKAALYSAALPGLGQAYNKKYWKIPVVYAGFGVFYYFINSNNKEYVKFRNAYNYKSGSDVNPSNYNEYVDKYSESSLLDGRNYYRRNRDLSIILTSFWYLLTITDAAVDAYLFDYDVGNDLSVQLHPTLIRQNAAFANVPGISISLQFK